ncbi:MAG: hypothetical protein COV29_04040 [Candidatus Yanofskybacteria bacterium CG10_big_fil_rev_8_21_14_0_10_36_16]|uniref:Uncharacterized protein n=1 Tax=Candidatus Yanofskybacteria bacterium CG10_big_fil_rev_8_21_14_0_10_36_16 TaxID=1975096 RepID=A0A2J0Q6V8_9BACT|nr:MAG: hypothetical protein COV29_04040 [Candidatus Yanofskybacteria bacterium CG10_big_fil_rev_8_21_14_0_10_36_16]
MAIAQANNLNFTSSTDAAQNVGPNLGPAIAQIATRAFDFVQNFDYVGLLSTLRFISYIFTVIFVLILGYILYKVSQLSSKGTGSSMPLEGIKDELSPPQPAQSAYDARWKEIKKHAESFNVAEWKFAVVEGDKLVHDTLKKAGFGTGSMGDILESTSHDQLPEIGNLWDAHKLRNLLVHDSDYELTHNQALAAINVFERVLKELGAIN